MEEHIPFPVRINRYLALRGLTTRKAADGLIASGRVTVNGAPAILGMKINVDDQVEIKGEIRSKPYRYFAYYKPKGIITHSPVRGEKAIADIFPEKGVFPIGRLDKASEGLIILTDDGRVTERLLHPRFVHEKEYEVIVREALLNGVVERLLQGVVSDGEKLSAKRVSKMSRTSLAIVLVEGKKHHIRRMLDAVHLTVKELKRVRIMGLQIGTLVPGEGRRIVGRELETFLSDLGLAPSR